MVLAASHGVRTLNVIHKWVGRMVPGLLVSHILYADDTLLFCNTGLTQVGYLRCVLFCFEAVSGLKVNLGKSEMISVGAVEDIGALAQVLGCKVASLSARYLGLPLGSSFKTRQFGTLLWKDFRIDWRVGSVNIARKVAK